MSLKLHELPGDKGNRQTRKRVGRGEASGQGRTSGKGNKGHQARSGGAKSGSFEGGQMPLVRRLPKFGFSNASFRAPRGEVTLRQLNRFANGTTVDRALLHKAGLVKKSAQRIKVICKGMLEKQLTVRLEAFSPGAMTAIESRGGKWEIAKAE